MHSVRHASCTGRIACGCSWRTCAGDTLQFTVFRKGNMKFNRKIANMLWSEVDIGTEILSLFNFVVFNNRSIQKFNIKEWSLEFLASQWKRLRIVELLIGLDNFKSVEYIIYTSVDVFIHSKCNNINHDRIYRTGSVKNNFILDDRSLNKIFL